MHGVVYTCYSYDDVEDGAEEETEEEAKAEAEEEETEGETEEEEKEEEENVKRKTFRDIQIENQLSYDIILNKSAQFTSLKPALTRLDLQLSSPPLD